MQIGLWANNNMQWIIPALLNLTLGIMNTVLVIRNKKDAKVIRQKEKQDDIDREEFKVRNEGVYKPLWKQINDIKQILLSDTKYYMFMLQNDLSTFGAPDVNVTYLENYLCSADSLLEKTSLNQNVETLIRKIQEYNSSCLYAAQEISFIYSNILSKHTLDFTKRYKCEKIKIGYNCKLDSLYVLFEALNNKDFFYKYIENIDTQIDEELKSRFLTHLSVEGHLIRSEVDYKIRKDFNLLSLFLNVKNEFMSVEGMLRLIIQDGINMKEKAKGSFLKGAETRKYEGVVTHEG